jgi:rhodanese-related sulfurtransferase
LSGSITISQLRTETSSSAQLVDVRSTTEFDAGHIPGAVNIPMDQIESRLNDLSRTAPVILICKAGTRARITAELLSGCGHDFAVLEGGTDAWVRSGLPVVSSVKTRWALERQVRLVAGLLILVGVALTVELDRRWLLLPAFVGLGLSFAGLSDFCPMGELLTRMPWNRKSHCKLGIPDAAPQKSHE